MRLVVFVVTVWCATFNVTADPTEVEIAEILQNYNLAAQPLCTQSVTASWESNVDIENDKKLKEAVRKLKLKSYLKVQDYNNYSNLAYFNINYGISMCSDQAYNHY